MKKILLTLAASTVLSAMSQPRHELPYIARDLTHIPDFVMPTSAVQRAPVKTTQPQSAEAEDTANVTVTFDSESTGDIFIYNSDIFINVVNGVDFDGKSYVFQVKKGNYDICGIGSQGMVVKENVAIDKDTEVEIDMNQVTETITFVGQTPMGEEIIPPSSGEEEQIETPTVDFFCTAVMVYREGVGIVSMSITSSYEFKSSPLSEKYKIFMSDYIRNKTWVAVSTGYAIGTGKKTINLNRDYVKVDPEVLKWDRPDPEGRNTHAFEYGVVLDDLNIPLGLGTMFDIRPDVFLASGAFSVEGAPEYRTLAQYGILFGASVDMTLPFYNDNGIIRFVNANHDGCGNGMFSNKEGGRYSVCFPGHPAYNYDSDEVRSHNGESSPSASVMTMSLDRGKGARVTFLLPCYIGRRGEVRNSDHSAVSTQVRVNGETVFEDATEPISLLGWLAERYEGAERTKVEVTWVNKNFTVDGLQGSNITTINYDETLEDETAPQLQMLSFKDEVGQFTDRFKKAADGIIEFSVGDFDWVNGENYTFWYTVDQPTVKVEYAPYGEDEFSPLVVDEVPELFMMPNFGYFYRGSLSVVNRSSDTGWYDLRFTLTDENGNQTVQTISPAFKIGKGAGLNAVAVESEVKVVGRSVNAPEGSRIYRLDGTEAGTSDLMPGVYIVAAPAGATKIVIQ